MLQRLVDGELELQEIQRLLAQAQDDPRQWETLATALVEDQLWHRAVSHLPEQAGRVPPVAAPRPAPSGRRPASGPTQAAPRWGWLAVVASLLVGCGLGYLAQPGTTIPTATPGEVLADRSHQVANGSLAAADPTFAEDGRTLTAYRPDYHLEVPADSEIFGDSPAAAPTSVPLYNVSTPQQWERFQQQQPTAREISPQLLRRLEAAGYLVQQDIEFISGDMNPDQRFIVPVRRLRLIPSQ
jgi:hypothetical protein